MYIDVFGELTMVGLRRTKYQINFQEEVFEFEAIIYNAWNRKFVAYYLNVLIRYSEKG
jgi:predicted nuclease of restriction endonuclease-like (RecB) superfamily